MKRFLLTTVALCILVSSLALTSGTVHAQARTSLAPQHTTIAADQPTMYFNAGNWGWGICYSHSDLQAMEGNTGYGRFVLDSTLSWRFGGAGVAAAIVIEGWFWYMNHMDRGNGVCTAWAYGLWWLPVFWSR